jgi:putative hemolysin
VWDSTSIFLLVLLPLLLAASGFFSGSETALFNLSAHERLTLRRSGGLTGAVVLRLLANTRHLLITLMLANMVLNVLYFIITTVLILKLKKTGTLGTFGVGLVSLGVLLALILGGEVVPKLLATRLALTWSKLAAVPLMFVHRTILPLRLFLNTLVITPLARLIAPRRKPQALTPQELEALLSISEAQGVIDQSEEQLLQKILELGQLTVRDVMTPRVDIQAFDQDDDTGDLLALIERTHRRRIPVYQGDIDHVVGVVSARQILLRRPQTRADLLRLIDPAQFVPEQQHADRLLLAFRQSGTTLALVVDEYGGTAGLVTLEDVVEQMVGQITDAGEPLDVPMVESAGPGQWRVHAGLSIRAWNDAFGQARPIGAVSTIGGLVMARLGRLPVVGDSTRLGNLDIRVAEMQARRIHRLELQLLPADSSGNAPLSGGSH